MTATDEDFYRSAVRRMLHWMAFLGGAGTLGFWMWRGWRWGAGFALGAVIAWLNFLWLKRMADALGTTGERPRTAGAAFLGSRYLLLGALAYVILKYSEINLMAALGGLFVSLAAAIAEILFELVYARI
ncbi:MAG: ATP synthase subunit I [Acidobacteriia bacterium]|nr:ATP synthase subunit I [Terriglobia bacterium]